MPWACPRWCHHYLDKKALLAHARRHAEQGDCLSCSSEAEAGGRPRWLWLEQPAPGQGDRRGV